MTTQPSPKLIKLYEEMAALTKPKCGQCRFPYLCCKDFHCVQTEKYAKTLGVTLQSTGHPHLRFLGADGCVVPPYLRPICAVHVCENHLWNPEFSNQYFKLRDKICKLECKATPYPPGCADCHGELEETE